MQRPPGNTKKRYCRAVFFREKLYLSPGKISELVNKVSPPLLITLPLPLPQFFAWYNIRSTLSSSLVYIGEIKTSLPGVIIRALNVTCSLHFFAKCPSSSLCIRFNIFKDCCSSASLKIKTNSSPLKRPKTSSCGYIFVRYPQKLSVQHIICVPFN